MAVRSASDITKILQNMFPDNASDEMLNVLADIADSVGTPENFEAEKAALEAKVQETDAAWRKKFMDRFSGTTPATPPETTTTTAPPEPETKEPETFEDLFIFK